MARTIEQIKQQIITQKNADSTLSGLNSPSQTAIYNLWAFITAVAIGIFEQLLDLYKSDIETIVSKSHGSHLAWIRVKVLEWQNGDNILLNTTDYNYYYAVVDTLKNIVTRVSVNNAPNKTVIIKVAKSDPPEPLSAGEVVALGAYINEICSAGITYLVTSTDSDKLYIRAEIFYNGQYASTIEDDVKGAIDLYLQNLSSVENFNGVIKVSALQDAIQQVIGVDDVVLKEVRLRADLTDFVNGTVMIGTPDTAIQEKSLNTYSGYVVTETETGQTIDDTLTFTTV